MTEPTDRRTERERVMDDLANALDYLGRMDELDSEMFAKVYGNDDLGYTSAAIVQGILSDLYDHLEGLQFGYAEADGPLSALRPATGPTEYDIAHGADV